MSAVFIKPEDNRNTYHHGDLYRSLLDAALELINEEGLDGLSLRKMASRCNVSQTAPYRHFASKEHLLAVLAERGCDELLTKMNQAVKASSGTWVDSITNLLLMYVRFAQNNCSYFQMIFNLRMLDRSNYPSLSKAMSKHRELLVDVLVESGFSPQSAKSNAYHFWAHAHGMATLIINRQWCGSDADNVSQQIRSFVELFDVRPSSL